MSVGGMRQRTLHTAGPPTKTTASGPRTVSEAGSRGGFFEEIAHTADVALRCGGPDLEALFRSAARGLYHLMGTASGGADTPLSHALSLAAEDVEGLLVEWLGELAYLVESKGLVFEAMAFDALSATGLEARLTGRSVEGTDRLIKAVTYHGLKVERTPEGVAATVVFDV